jgi:hypothetical protein
MWRGKDSCDGEAGGRGMAEGSRSLLTEQSLAHMYLPRCLG